MYFENIPEELYDLIEKARAVTKVQMPKLEQATLSNQAKILKAFQKEQIGYQHFQTTTGYGYGDLSRETLENVYANIFNSEAALVRGQIASGTHAIACCLYGNLKPQEVLLSVTGSPYDTLEEVIGFKGEIRGSLKDLGVEYKKVDLDENQQPDFESIANNVEQMKPRMVLIQRSRGYTWRPSLAINQIQKIINIVKSIDNNIICFVDNCYGEFVEGLEPTDVGADLIAGSLIKNPGGGLVPAGGYIVGKAEYVNNAANRLTAPGIGSHVGATLIDPRLQYQGLFMAAHVVKQALLSAIYSAAIFEQLGFEASPKSNEERFDIIQGIKLNCPDLMVQFCQALQYYSPIESNITPEPAPMAGYNDKVIMAGGTFVQGSSIELSADGPIRPPYAIYLQGGLCYEHSQLALNGVIAHLFEENLLTMP